MMRTSQAKGGGEGRKAERLPSLGLSLAPIHVLVAWSQRHNDTMNADIGEGFGTQSLQWMAQLRCGSTQNRSVAIVAASFIYSEDPVALTIHIWVMAHQ